MTFPDQSQINRVRDALWKPSAGGASLMVGSGFSRNASTTSSDAHVAPTWADLAEALYNILYPTGEYGGSQSAHSRESKICHPTKLAQEYEVSLGRDHLHRFIKRQVRDTQLMPGALHYSLLRLPWRDIFTTNWDTLLEQASGRN